MSPPTIKTLFAAALSILLAACSHRASAPTPTKQAAPISKTDAALSSQLFQQINAYRRSQGVPDLQRHAGLDRMAQEHSEYLRQHRGTFQLSGKNVSHIGSEGRALYARRFYHMESTAENVVAENYPNKNHADVILNIWKNSKDHRKNLLDQWTQTGLGVVVDKDGMVFATELFATVNNSQMTSRQRFSQF